MILHCQKKSSALGLYLEVYAKMPNFIVVLLLLAASVAKPSLAEPLPSVQIRIGVYHTFKVSSSQQKYVNAEIADLFERTEEILNSLPIANQLDLQIQFIKWHPNTSTKSRPIFNEFAPMDKPPADLYIIFIEPPLYWSGGNMANPSGAVSIMSGNMMIFGDFYYATRADKTTLLLHELGHIAGLDHPSDEICSGEMQITCGDAAMYPEVLFTGQYIEALDKYLEKFVQNN